MYYSIKMSDSAHSNSNKQVDEINDSEEQVDARNWLRNDYAKQIDQINDSDKQVDAIINDSKKLVDAIINYSDKQVDATSDSKKLVVTGSDPKSDPSSNPKAATLATNRNFAQNLLISQFVLKIIPVVIQPINTPITANVVDVQDILSPHQTVLLKASFMDATCRSACIFRGTSGKLIWTNMDKYMPQDISCNESYRLSSQGPSCIGNSVFPTQTGNQDISTPVSKKGFSAVNGHCTSYFRSIIGLEAVSAEVADVNPRKKYELHE